MIQVKAPSYVRRPLLHFSRHIGYMYLYYRAFMKLLS